MEKLNKKFILSRIRKLELKELDYQKYGLTKKQVFDIITTEEYDLLSIIKIAIILNCTTFDLFI